MSNLPWVGRSLALLAAGVRLLQVGKRYNMSMVIPVFHSFFVQSALAICHRERWKQAIERVGGDTSQQCT